MNDYTEGLVEDLTKVVVPVVKCVAIALVILALLRIEDGVSRIADHFESRPTAGGAAR